MAECSYARCLQERRLIKRELLKWSKDMLHIAGLERVAEELMGRRKWKHFQEALTRTHLSTEHLTVSIEQTHIVEPSKEVTTKLDSLRINGSPEEPQPILLEAQKPYEENHRQGAQQEEGTHHSDVGVTPASVANITEEETTKSTSHNHKGSEEITTDSKSPAATPNILSKDNITNTAVKEPDHSNIPPTSPASPPDPIDWKPNDKCNFCVNGKLLTVNENGELVAESGPAVSETDQQPQQFDSDSDSHESSNLVGGPNEAPTASNRFDFNKLLASHLKNNKNMTSMDSMAARLAAIQSISGYPNFDWQTKSATPTTSDISAAAVSPSLKDSPSPSDATGEQPLDLSSKSLPNSSLSGDLKNVRTKSARSTPIPTARRSYSDEDLKNALEDILSGKLGTRKASVEYRVPRSTLRNKVYKLSMEAKRNNAQTPAELRHLQREFELDNDLSGDEGDDSNASTPQPEPHFLADDLANRIATSAMLRKLCENNGDGNNDGSVPSASPKPLGLSAKRQASTPSSTGHPQPQGSPPPQMAPMYVDPNILMLLLSASGMGALLPKLPETVTLREFFNAILLNSGINMKDALAAAAAASNVTGQAPGEENALNNGKLHMPMLAQQFQQRLAKPENQEAKGGLEASGTNDDPAAILKIPSYKPIAGNTTATSGLGAGHGCASPTLLANNNSNSTSNRNGDSPHSAPSPHMANSLLAAAVAAAGGSSAPSPSNRPGPNVSVISPPHMHHHSMNANDSQSPTGFNVRDVIANSIHRTMNEQAHQDAHGTSSSMLGLNSDAVNPLGPDYKKPSISVVKNIGGTDTTRFGAAPNLLAAVSGGTHSTHHHHPQHAHLSHGHHPHHHSSHHLSRQEAAALAAGKGTRPKRGKYRNYDRDSLVEAVKAVQRGEMSVHRAGSYYGVPHSTLEYKVKERHLMRPRKREPKPQPGLDGSSSTSAAKPTSNIPGLNNLDKMKAVGNAANSKLSSALKSNNNTAPTFPNAAAAAAANGMKLPMFDAAVAAQLQYPPQLFWSHTQAAFASMHMGGAGGNVNPDLLKSHMQRYQEEAMRAASAGGSSNANANSPSPIPSPMSAQNNHGLSMKSARELEHLYESRSPNGSFILDGIIRKTLDRKSNDAGLPHSGALLDHLVKQTPLPFTNNRSNEYASASAAAAMGLKRSGSPISFATDIKRERTSPSHSSDDDGSQSAGDDGLEHNNNKSVCSGNGGLHGEQRSRMTSRDSETDASSLHSELMAMQQHHSNSSKMCDLNGGNAVTKSESPLQGVGSTSILQEKLAQIKAEQESEEKL